MLLCFEAEAVFSARRVEAGPFGSVRGEALQVDHRVFPKDPEPEAATERDAAFQVSSR